MGEWENGRNLLYLLLITYYLLLNQEWGGMRRKEYILFTYYLLPITYDLNLGWGEWEIGSFYLYL